MDKNFLPYTIRPTDAFLLNHPLSDRHHLLLFLFHSLFPLPTTIMMPLLTRIAHPWPPLLMNKIPNLRHLTTDTPLRKDYLDSRVDRWNCLEIFPTDRAVFLESLRNTNMAKVPTSWSSHGRDRTMTMAQLQRQWTTRASVVMIATLVALKNCERVSKSTLNSPERVERISQAHTKRIRILPWLLVRAIQPSQMNQRERKMLQQVLTRASL